MENTVEDGTSFWLIQSYPPHKQHPVITSCLLKYSFQTHVTYFYTLNF